MVKYGMVLVLVIGCVSLAFAGMPDAKNVQAVYEGATVACTVCHPAGKFKEVTPYGKDYMEAGRSVDAVKAIGEKDSDADGIANAAEIKAGTNPGVPEAK